jgi:hypothetical protein
MEEPRDARDAMDIILRWIQAAADVSFLHEGRVCLEQFNARNFDRFNVVFSATMWAHSRDNLRRAATTHGQLTTFLTLEKDPNRKEADFDAFIEAGKWVRDHCRLHMEAVLKSRSLDAKPDHVGTVRGMWCSWPS